MRNIKWVVLWESLPSFCALVQRAGHAARDLSTLGEAILIVSQSVFTKGTTDMEVEVALEAVQTEAKNRGDEEIATLENNGIQLVDEGGVRIGHQSEEEDEEEKKAEKKRRRKQTKANFNSQEAKFLSLFACTTQCRRIIWDDFFGNKTKSMCQIINMMSHLCSLQQQSNSLQRQLSSAPCMACDAVTTASHDFLKQNK